MRSATAASLPANEHAQPVKRVAHSAPRFTYSEQEEQLINLNLSDLSIPKMNDLHVEGLKPSWFARLFGKR